MTAQPNNRWLRFSLRTMLVVVTVACVLLASKVRQAEWQREVVAWVNANGTRKWCTYDYETGDCKPPGPEWLIEVLGVDYFATVVDVSLWGDDITDISPLAKLPQLRTLLLNGTQVSDLRPLRTLSSLS